MSVQGLDADTGTITRAIAELEALALGEHPSVPHPPGSVLGDLNVYRWWQSANMRLPALWHWLMPSPSERRGQCGVEDTVSIVVTLATLPAADAGEDMLSVEAYLDAYLPVIDAAVNLRGFAGTVRAKRTGFALVNETLGNQSVLTAEVSLELILAREPTP